MSALTDLIVRATEGNMLLAFLIIGLGVIDVLQTKFLKREFADVGKRFDRQGQRIARLEDSQMQTDGGQVEDE